MLASDNPPELVELVVDDAVESTADGAVLLAVALSVVPASFFAQAPSATIDSMAIE
jgi:hypothetical protein